jgi:hypothetical protein
MGKERAPSQRLPPEILVEPVRLHGEQDQPGLPGEVPLRRLDDLVAAGEVDEAVTPVVRRTVAVARGFGCRPFGGRQQL